MARKDITLDSCPNNLVEKEIVGGKEIKKGERKEREEEGRERSSTFSLVFPAIGLSVLIRAIRKVIPRGKRFK